MADTKFQLSKGTFRWLPRSPAHNSCAILIEFSGAFLGAPLWVSVNESGTYGGALGGKRKLLRKTWCHFRWGPWRELQRIGFAMEFDLVVGSVADYAPN